MPHPFSTLAVAFLSLTVVTLSSAAQRDPAASARSANYIGTSTAITTTSHAKNVKRTCTQVCVKNDAGSYHWKDTADTCNTETEQCRVQGTASAVKTCQSDFDELLTQRGICVPRKER